MEKQVFKITNGLLTGEKLEPITAYIKNDSITDIDWNGEALWLRNTDNRRFKENNPAVTADYINSLIMHIANAVSQQFNTNSPILEAEMESLRFTCIHESVALRGRAICIRKVKEKGRLTYEALKNTYCDEKILNLLINCAASRINMVICGEPGVGKTEFAKFLSMYIPDSAKTITIEDTREWYYSKLKPQADGLELLATRDNGYGRLIKTAMRLNPGRIMLAETRSREAADLLEAWSTGVKGITTLHTDDLRNVPNRFLNMMEAVGNRNYENNIYEFLDVGVLLKARKDTAGNYRRYIDQVAFYGLANGSGTIRLILEDGVPTGSDIPADALKKLSEELIYEPYSLNLKVPQAERRGN